MKHDGFESHGDSRMLNGGSKLATEGYGESSAPSTQGYDTTTVPVIPDNRKTVSVTADAIPRIGADDDDSDSATPPYIEFDFSPPRDQPLGKKGRPETKKAGKGRERPTPAMGNEMLPDYLRPREEVELYDHLKTKRFGAVFAMRILVMLLIVPVMSLIISGGKTWLAKFTHVYGLSGQTCILLLQLCILVGTAIFTTLWLMKVNIDSNQFLFIHRKSSILFDLAAGCMCFMMSALEAYYSTGHYYVAAQPWAVWAEQVDVVIKEGKVHPQVSIMWAVAACLLFLQGCAHIVLTVLVVMGWFY